MTALTAARLQMEVSLGFHMIFAALGVALPLLMVMAEGLWLRTGNRSYLVLAKTWAKATGLLFAIGAVSGTALAFELGLLWAPFMAEAGSIIGPAFTWEGYAFFLEAIFLGIYLYGWERLTPLQHWLAGIPIAISGAASSVLVVAANAYMQLPVTPLFANPLWPPMAMHSTLACYAAAGFAVAGVYAWGAWRGRGSELHRLALRLALAVGTVAAFAMPITGHISAQATARYQPAKLAAMEAQFRTEAGAPLRIGGWPLVKTGEVRYAVEIPGGLSWLAFGDAAAPVTGLDAFPVADWPSVPLTHISFQVMVGAGMLLIVVATWYWLTWRSHRASLPGRRLLLAILVASPLGFLALQAGWVVTEVGRQPWVIYGQMRTADAVTTAPGIFSTFLIFTVLYIILLITLIWLLRRIRHVQ